MNSDIRHRFAMKWHVDTESEEQNGAKCWVWHGAITSAGYGNFSIGGHRQSSHIVSYNFVFGNVPDGLEIDHLCGNRKCINPLHLEAVTHSENVKRGRACINRRARTHCRNGHPFSQENAYSVTDSRTGKTIRACRTCRREISSRWRRNNPEKARSVVQSYEERNPEREKLRHEKYRRQNINKIREQQRISARKRRAANPEKYREINRKSRIKRSGAQKEKTHCDKGHEWNNENTILNTQSDGKTKRRCRVCQNAYAKIWRQRNLQRLRLYQSEWCRNKRESRHHAKTL